MPHLLPDATDTSYIDENVKLKSSGGNYNNQSGISQRSASRSEMAALQTMLSLPNSPNKSTLSEWNSSSKTSGSPERDLEKKVDERDEAVTGGLLSLANSAACLDGGKHQIQNESFHEGDFSLSPEIAKSKNPNYSESSPLEHESQINADKTTDSKMVTPIPMEASNGQNNIYKNTHHSTMKHTNGSHISLLNQDDNVKDVEENNPHSDKSSFRLSKANFRPKLYIQTQEESSEDDGPSHVTSTPSSYCNPELADEGESYRIPQANYRDNDSYMNREGVDSSSEHQQQRYENLKGHVYESHYPYYGHQGAIPPQYYSSPQHQRCSPQKLGSMYPTHPPYHGPPYLRHHHYPSYPGFHPSHYPPYSYHHHYSLPPRHHYSSNNESSPSHGYCHNPNYPKPNQTPPPKNSCSYGPHSYPPPPSASPKLSTSPGRSHNLSSRKEKSPSPRSSCRENNHQPLVEVDLPPCKKRRMISPILVSSAASSSPDTTYRLHSWQQHANNEYPNQEGRSMNGEINSVAHWQQVQIMNGGFAPSANRCVPLKSPVPSKFWGDVEKTKDAYVPDFHRLVNFPDYLPKNRPPPGDGMRCCVMCGKQRLCTASMSKNNASNASPVINAYKSDGKPKSSAVSTDDTSSKSSSNATTHIIPRQNKGLCTACDVAVWVVTATSLEIKWCKGCKNFRPWAAFGDKGLATKCVRCRDRQREKYALQKDNLKKNQNNVSNTTFKNPITDNSLRNNINKSNKKSYQSNTCNDKSEPKAGRDDKINNTREIDAARGLSNLLVAAVSTSSNNSKEE